MDHITLMESTNGDNSLRFLLQQKTVTAHLRGIASQPLSEGEATVLAESLPLASGIGVAHRANGKCIDILFDRNDTSTTKASIYYHTPQPSVAILGSHSVADARRSAHFVRNMLKEAGVKYWPSLQVDKTWQLYCVNVQASAIVRRRVANAGAVRISRLAEDHDGKVTFDPEFNAGAHFRFDLSSNAIVSKSEQGVSVSIYGNGNLNMHCKNEGQVQHVLTSLETKLAPYWDADGSCRLPCKTRRAIERSTPAVLYDCWKFRDVVLLPRPASAVVA
jgi:hypothetical protein